MLDEIAQVELAVEDLEASRLLYGEQLGLEEISCASTAQGLGVCLFAVGASILALHQTPAKRSSDSGKPGQPPVVDHFALLVDDLQATYETLKTRNIPSLGEPASTAIGHRNMQRALLAFEDPDGLHVQISETIDPRPHIEARKVAKRHMAESGSGHFGGFDHISTYCTHFEAARGFFGTQLGMEEFFHSTTREAGENVQDGFAQAAFAVGGTDIELATAPLGEPLTTGVIRQLSFWTADLDAAARHMKDSALRFSGPEDWASGSDIQGRVLSTRSPDALDVQVVQRSRTST
jgi:catechol 2,3-dioxygenase-like lactoylglutathione lyase family enzyme